MPRGCVTVMERGGYAANGIKHCVRPVDMTGTHTTNFQVCRRPIADWVSPGRLGLTRLLHPEQPAESSPVLSSHIGLESWDSEKTVVPGDCC